ncbi:FAD-binding dehydrogenase [Noviherbaspirillum autotrophicum]|uniref:Fumarate reductase n=1 Tax=Noviherbaspirillum autotrophicum TaxID=709839 RepID=A0A0C2BNB8_9BURK|nr:FAD-binding dehydrogenase [Noviherbaspirillum autotrophicum]KIF81514.1 fumarate reductase [Noviherbaspirillum autotrophicum]
MRQYQSDVVIIGGGLAGIVAAQELLSAGKSVTLLDRDDEQNFGGLAKESFGGILMVGTPEQRRSGIRDTPDLALRDWLSFGDFGRDKAAELWPRRWAEAYVNDSHGEIYCWLKERGVRFLPLPLWVERGQFGGGNSVPRWHVTWGTGHGLATQLIRTLLAHPRRQALTLAFRHRVDDLSMQAGRISGCCGATEDSNEEFTARADTVLVATGGINGSIDRVRKHWHAEWNSPPQAILNGSHKFADGLLHDAVQSAGGNVTHLDRMWNYAAGVHHWRPRKAGHGLSLVPPRSALWLNWRGERIGPQPLVSGFDTRELVTRICHEERAYSWQILNQKIALKELAVSGAEFNPSLRDKSIPGFLRDTLFGNRWLVRQMTENCIDFVTASSLPELVDKMNALQGDRSVDLGTVRSVVESYDAEIARGPALHNDEQLRRIAHLRQWRGDRIRTCKFRKILDPGAMPLIAIREFIISRKSLGGIQTDLDSRVLDTAGKPISGLYAAGEAAGFGGGGMNGLRGLEGTFLGGCVYSARRAARAIAGRISDK